MIDGFCMDKDDVIDNSPLICCCLLSGDIKLTGPFCNGDPGVMTWFDDDSVNSDGLSKPPVWLTIELVWCVCCNGGDIDVGVLLLLLLWWPPAATEYAGPEGGCTSLGSCATTALLVEPLVEGWLLQTKKKIRITS